MLCSSGSAASGARRLDEAGSAAVAGVAQERKLRYQQNLAAHLADAEVHLALFVFKHAQPGKFVGAQARVAFAVAVCAPTSTR